MMLMQSFYVFLTCDFLVKSPDSLDQMIFNSPGESSRISPESVKMLMTHSAEVVIDDCDPADARGGGKQNEFLIFQFCFLLMIILRL